MNPFARKLTLSLRMAVVLCGVLVALNAAGQRPATPSVPHLVAFSGTVLDTTGHPRAGLTGLTFALYKDQDGGAPLWLETQSITLDAKGHYAVQLGATRAEGVPGDLFVTGEARWLGVRAEGQAEQPRVLLVSVPYAMKAADADTIGGRPASAFVLAPAPAPAPTTSTGNSISPAAPPPATITGTGTVNFLPIWTTTTNLGNSALFQTGTGSTAKVGINTITPASPLDINGGTTFRGPANLVAIGNATSAAGKNSQFEGFAASAFSSSTAKAVAQTFRWQAEPTGNNTATPGASFNLLFGSGTTVPAETGFRFGSNGQITFAPGQTFPGTGTISGVTAGTGLSGGGTTGNVSLSLLKTCATGQTLSWNGTSWVCANLTGGGTITGVTAGTSLSGGGTSGNVTLNLNLASTDSRYAQLAAANTFTQNQTVEGNLAVKRSDTTPNGTRLDVVNTSTAGSSYAIFAASAVNGGVSTAQYADGLGTGPLGTPGGYFGTFSGHPMGLFTGNQERVFIGANGLVGIPTKAPAALLNVNQGPSANTFLVGSTSKGLLLRDTGVSLDLESLGAPLYINNTQLQSLYLNPSGGTVAVGTTDVSSGAALTVSAGTTNLFALQVFGAIENDGGGLATLGSILIGNDLHVGGSKNFRIDHPLDPENKYLKHASIESSEVLNLYTGNVILNDAGEATVTFPEWFSAINVDFRYQLTAVDAPGPNLYIAQKLKDGHFRIAGGKPGAEVSWQVTCRRNDPYMQAHPFVVEEDKPAEEIGFYQAPDLYGQPAERGILSKEHKAEVAKRRADAKKQTP